MMDEITLEESLKGYNDQVAQIQAILRTADELTKLELYDLEKDLKELISVTEERLFTLKKKKLLASLEKDNENTSSTSTTIHREELKSCGEPSSSTVSSSSLTDERNQVEEDQCDDFVGTKCRVKYTQEWGSFQYHNAMVLSVDEYESVEGEPSYKARVLFLNPIHKNMVTCKYFMDANCQYTEEECRFSHGFQVDIEDLEEYEDPDFTKLAVGGYCLAQHSDGVWYKANIVDFHDEQLTISFHTKKETLTLDYHFVIPIDTPDSFSSSEDENEEDTVDSDSDKTETGFAQLSYKSLSMSGPLGDWEEHTKGIGSKIMAKMGYIIGKGLGKNHDGRIEPVEIRLLPPGKSLDRIAELREKGFIKDPTKKKNNSARKQIAAEFREQNKKERESSTFNLIDGLTNRSKGNKKGGHSNTLHNSVEDTYKTMKRDFAKQKHEVRNREKPSKHSNVNIQLFKNSEKVSALNKRLAKLKESLLRNPEDTKVSRTIKFNISEAEKELERLHHIDRSLQTKAHMKTQTKKLTIF